MKIKITLYVIVVILGLASGKSALVAARSAAPPIDWGSIQFAFIGSVIGMVFVIGIQKLRKKPKYGGLSIIAMFIISLYFLSSGVSALIISRSISPASIFIFVIGLGALLGVGLSLLLFRFRHAETP